MVAASSDLAAQLSASESDRARLQREGTELNREAVRLKEQLVDRDEQFRQLAQQFNVLRRKYEHLKGTYNEVMWGYLPANSPEFRSLDVSYPGGCSVVAFESDSHVDSIELFSVLGTGSFGDVHLGSHHGPNGETEVALKTVAKVRIRSLASLRNLANEVACMRHLTQVLAAPQRPEAAGLDHIVTLIHASISDTNVYLAQSNGGSDLFTLIGLSSRSGADKARLPVEIVAAVARGLDTLLEEDDVDALPRSRVADRESTFSGLVLILLACALVALALLGVVAVWRPRPCATSGAAEQETAGIEMRDGFLPLLDDNLERAVAPMLLPVEMSATEAPVQELNVSFAALRSSPATVFGIDTAMRIVLWSRGEA